MLADLLNVLCGRPMRYRNGRRNLRCYARLLWATQGGRCAGCGWAFYPSEMHVDHIFPRSRGGGDGIENLQMICRRCNRSKGAKTMAEWKSA